MSGSLTRSSSALSPAPGAIELELSWIFSEYAGYAIGLMRRLGVRPADVQDMAQEVFVVVQRKLPDFDGRSSLKTWICGIAVHLAANHRRRACDRREQLGVETDSAGPAAQDAWSALVSARDRAALLSALDALEPRLRDVFVLYEVEGLGMIDVASILGCRRFTGYTRLHTQRGASCAMRSSGSATGAGTMTERRDTSDARLQRAIADLRTHPGTSAAVAELAQRLAARAATPGPSSAVRDGLVQMLKSHAPLIGMTAVLIGSAWWGAVHLAARNDRATAPNVQADARRPASTAHRRPRPTAGALPHPRALARRGVPAAGGTSSAGALPPRAAAAGELALLAAAQRALARDAERALALMQQHAREFPASAFVEEREVLVLEAELELRHRDAARERARRFVARFPRSAHAVRVRALASGATIEGGY